MWEIENSGFLPSSEPLFSLSINDIRNTELSYTWETLSQVVPFYLKEECAREEIVYALRKASHSYYHGFVESLGSVANYERAFLLLAYLSTAYANAPEGKKKNKLPKEISLPFGRIATEFIFRQPVLDYTSFILYNWKKKNANAGIVTSNLQPLNTFTDTPEEESLISTLLEVEYTARDLSEDSMVNLKKLISVNQIIAKSFSKISKEFFELWGKLVDDYESMFYEQWSIKRFNFHCDITMQTPIVSFFYKYLDINFKDDYLREREQIKRFQRPKTHNLFLDQVVGARYSATKNKYLREVYNNSITELILLYKNLSIREKDKLVLPVIEEELNGYFLL